MKDPYLWIVSVLVVVMIFCSTRATVKISNHTNTYTDTVTVTDTVTYYHVVTKDTLIVRYKYVTVPIRQKEDTARQDPVGDVHASESGGDSVLVSIPISQNRYDGDEYCAYISGYGVSLDSMFIFRKNTVVNSVTQRSKQNKWSLGVQLGVTVQNRKISPYVGVGVSYSLFSW